MNHPSIHDSFIHLIIDFIHSLIDDFIHSCMQLGILSGNVGFLLVTNWRREPCWWMRLAVECFIHPGTRSQAFIIRTLYFCCLFHRRRCRRVLLSLLRRKALRRILDLQGSFGQLRSSSLAEASGSPEIKPTFEAAGIQLGHLKIKYADGAFWILYYCRELAGLNIIPSESHVLNGFLPRSTTLHCRRFLLQKKSLLSWSRAHANHFAAIYI